MLRYQGPAKANRSEQRQERKSGRSRGQCRSGESECGASVAEQRVSGFGVGAGRAVSIDETERACCYISLSHVRLHRGPCHSAGLDDPS